MLHESNVSSPRNNLRSLIAVSFIRILVKLRKQTRKSTQKRQKQYFEQRRRQQQLQNGGLESYEEGGEVNLSGQNCKQHRSLDILSLCNLSSISHHSNGRGDSKANASPIKCLITMDQPTILDCSVLHQDSREIKEARSISGCQPETASPTKTPYSSSDNCSNAFNNVVDDKPDLRKIETQQQPCFFDLLGEDAPMGNLEVNPAIEAHVAFSIEGLGKVGEETPPHSPQQPDRCISYGAAGQLNSSKNLGQILDDLVHEADAMIYDIDMALCGSSLEVSTGFDDSYINLKNDLSSVREHEQLDGYRNKMRSSFCGTKTFKKNENNNNTRSSLLDANFLGERESHMSSKSWPYGMDDNPVDFLKYGNDELIDYAFDRQPRKRDSMNVTRGLNILESLRRKESPDEYNFTSFEGARRHPMGKTVDFRDASNQPDWFCLVTEDTKDSTSLLSEESCSSAAVMGEETNISLSNFTARYCRRNENASGRPGIEGNAKCYFARERHFEKNDCARKGNNGCGSGRSSIFTNGRRFEKNYLEMGSKESGSGTWITSSESKSTHCFDRPFQEKIGPCESWLFEGGHDSETKTPSLGSKPFGEDISEAFLDPEEHIHAKFSFDNSKYDTPIKYTTSGNSFIPEKFPFHQSRPYHSHDFPTLSKVNYGATKPEFSPDSLDFELEGWSPDLSRSGVHQGKKLIPDLPLQQSLSNDAKNKSRFQQANCEKLESQQGILVGKHMNAIDALDSEVDGPECKETEDKTVETSSSANIPDKYESIADERECHLDPEAPVPCQNGNEGI